MSEIRARRVWASMDLSATTEGGLATDVPAVLIDISDVPEGMPCVGDGRRWEWAHLEGREFTIVSVPVRDADSGGGLVVTAACDRGATWMPRVDDLTEIAPCHEDESGYCPTCGAGDRRKRQRRGSVIKYRRSVDGHARPRRFANTRVQDDRRIADRRDELGGS